MKKLIFCIGLCLPLSMTAQHLEIENKADTVITKDPSNAGREYWKIHNIKGTLKGQGFMLKGKKDGMWRDYNDVTGVITKVTEYSNGIQNGASITFNASGVVQLDETYMNDKKNGQSSSYGNYGGRLKQIENYKDGVLEGTKIAYYDNGKMQEEGFYKNGKRNGIVKWYMQSGSPTMEYTYENGDLEGRAKVFDEKGRLKLEGFYKNNNEEGEWKAYEDSVLVKKIIYRAGQITKEVPVKK